MLQTFCLLDTLASTAFLPVLIDANDVSAVASKAQQCALGPEQLQGISQRRDKA